MTTDVEGKYEARALTGRRRLRQNGCTRPQNVGKRCSPIVEPPPLNFQLIFDNAPAYLQLSEHCRPACYLCASIRNVLQTSGGHFSLEAVKLKATQAKRVDRVSIFTLVCGPDAKATERGGK